MHPCLYPPRIWVGTTVTIYRHNFLTAPHEPYDFARLVVWYIDCTHLCLSKRHAVHLWTVHQWMHCMSTQQRLPASDHHRTPFCMQPCFFCGALEGFDTCTFSHWKVCRSSLKRGVVSRDTVPTTIILPKHKQAWPHHCVCSVAQWCRRLVSAPRAPWRCQRPQCFVLPLMTSPLTQTQPTHYTHVTYCPQQQQHSYIWAVAHRWCNRQP